MDEEVYEVIDVHGGHRGIPAWMTEPRWRGLQMASRPRVSRAVLNSLGGLLNALNSGSNGSERLSFEGGSDEASEAMGAATVPGGWQEMGQRGEKAGTGAVAGGTSVASTQE